MSRTRGEYGTGPTDLCFSHGQDDGEVDRRRELVRVTSVTVSRDHGVPVPYVSVEGRSWGQGFGGIMLDEPLLRRWDENLKSLFRVSTLDEVVGKECYALYPWPKRLGVDIEGLEFSGRRFTLTEFRRRHWPNDPPWDPLGREREKLSRSIAAAKARLARDIEDLERIEEGYVDWATSAAPGSK